MRKITTDELKKIKERVLKESHLSNNGYTVKVTVHLGTCGLAAGGEEALEVLNEEIAQSKKNDIKVVISACMGMCSSEPNVTVKRMGEESILYRDIDAEKADAKVKDGILNIHLPKSEKSLARNIEIKNA